MRLDRWLWSIRVYRSRTAAAEAVKAGRARVSGAVVKPAHEVQPGEVVTARFGAMTRTFRALASPLSRVGAKLVPQFAEELTPPEEKAKLGEMRTLPSGFRLPGTGRPTKRERRAIDELETSLPDAVEEPGDG